MKIRRIHQPEIFVDHDITPAMLVIDGHKTFGWYDTKYGKWYMPAEWEEVPPEPEWVEVTAECEVMGDRLAHPVAAVDSGFTVYIAQNKKGSYAWRKEDDCVKVGELVSWLEGDDCFTTHQKADLKRKCEIMQRPMLTVWEKKV